MHTFDSSQVTGSENQVSSKITSGVRGFLLHMIAAIEDVTITLLIEENFEHDLRTLSVSLLDQSTLPETWEKVEN